MALLTRFSALYNASNYAFGFGSLPALRISVGNVLTGSQIITLSTGGVTLTDGTPLVPLATNVPVFVGFGTNLETLTPSAINNPTPFSIDTCQVTFTFANTHGIGDLIRSSTFGLAEAIIAAHAAGGGLVMLDAAFLKNFANHAAMVTAITAVHGFTNVTVLDDTGTSGSVSYKSATDGAVLAATTVTLY